MHISDVSGTSLSFTFYAVFLRENIGFQFIFLKTKINPSYINESVIGCNLHLNVNVISLLTVEALSSGFEKKLYPCYITSCIPDSSHINDTRLLALVPSSLELILSSSITSLPVLKQNTF